MCTYNGCRVSRSQIIRLRNIEKELKNLSLDRPAQNGFDYSDWPIIKPILDGKDFEILLAHWEYIPESVTDEFQLRESRKKFTWLNARAETLLSTMYAEGAYSGRCLVLSTGFYEWRHLPKIGKRGNVLKEKEKIPYLIREKGNEIFFMAGISRIWTNERRQQSADTFAIVTTEANSLMQQIHNSKLRMPTILPEELAYEWIQPGLSKNRIKEIASFQLDPKQMEAWTISKGFLKEKDPTLKVVYENVPELL